MLRSLGLAITFIATLGTALAQDTPSPTAKPTKVEPLPKSMDELLNEDYEIVSIASGLGGFGFLLRQGKSWMWCTVSPQGDPPNGQNLSDCGTLN